VGGWDVDPRLQLRRSLAPFELRVRFDGDGRLSPPLSTDLDAGEAPRLGDEAPRSRHKNRGRGCAQACISGPIRGQILHFVCCFFVQMASPPRNFRGFLAFFSRDYFFLFCCYRRGGCGRFFFDAGNDWPFFFGPRNRL